MRRVAIGTVIVLSLVLPQAFLGGCSKDPGTAADKSGGAGGTSQPAAAASLVNLQAAYDGESNAHARYVAFAAKADEEGYAQVASLFRAAARAEQIHAGEHAEVIRKLGAAPKADVKAPEAKSTRENLEAAIKGETYERDVMYPEFIQKAREERQKDAIRSMNHALSAEKEHARLYTEALASMESWKTGKKVFYVCPVCGYTTDKAGFDKCPSCYTAEKKFEHIS